MFYLDTANIEEIKAAGSVRILRGVTTNPTILLKEKRSRKDSIQQILATTDGEVFVQAHGYETAEIIGDSELILNTFQNPAVALKIPAHLKGIEAIKRLKTKYPEVKVLATAIYSADQAIIAAEAGCDYVAPYINRMENNDIDALNVIRIIRNVYDDQGLSARILAASFKNTNQIIRTLEAGAHTVTVNYELFRQLADKDLALAAINKFNQDAKELETFNHEEK